MQRVVASCDVCQSIDPAPVKWTHGGLGVEVVWLRVAMDITHFRGRSYLSLIDCGPSRFSVWRPLRMQTSASVIEQLEAVFWERGAPEELLTDNDPAFRSRQFESFAAQWNMSVRFRCAHSPSGNGIVERCHRTVKVTAARKNCTIAEAVYWHNVSPRSDGGPASAPAERLYRYSVRVKGLDDARTADSEGGSADRCARAPYQRGDLVWVRPPGARCDQQYGEGVVTGVISEQAVAVDGMPRHIRDLRHRTQQNRSGADPSTVSDDVPLLVTVDRDQGRDEEEPPTLPPAADPGERTDQPAPAAEAEGEHPARPERDRRHPAYLNDYVTNLPNL